ncbi:interferon-induced protein 44-like [Tachysurus fulvidraco]|uniref:interferon-induced protein 44-like n=1 Tax=Tachysurus fulvidraco TaxID=1234273 RepID=UPI000F4E3096|nr:interferon-induced protein 44-like [Tachysurus fulvidraco]XP_047658825.1 interferon-induced protein 44-like [Tachysurus fulvidraco]
MGKKNSKPESEPEDFKQPWRNTDWNPSNLKSELSELLKFMGNHKDIKQFRILLHGPVGAGKSCFINSVRSVYKERIIFRAAEETSAGKSCTKTYITYKITDKDSVTLPFVLNDVMGLENQYKDGIHPDDVINVLHGRVKEGYKFNPVSPLIDTDPGYIHEPSLNDKVHCLVSVVDANSISLMENEMIQKMKAVRESALSLSIPHVVLMTKIDADVCPLVTKDLAEVYKSRKIKEKMQECSHTIGPPLKCIFRVSNYYKETEMDDKKDVLILSALKAFVGFVKDYIEDLNI